MTLRYVDGWDYLPTGTGNDARLEASGYYLRGGSGAFDVGNIANNISAPGRFGYGNCLSWNGLVGSQGVRLQMIRPINPGNAYSAGIMGMAIAIGKTSVVPFQVCFYDAVNDQAQCYVEFLPNGIIKAYGGSGVLLATTYAGAYYYDEWFWFEFKASIANTGGTMEVRINTVTVISVPSADTQTSGNANFDSYQFSTRSLGIGNTFIAAVDDFYILDTGGTVNNSFLGNVRVKTQFTASAGDLAQFTASGAATNWQAALNKNTDDTIYNYSPTVGQEDLYHMQAVVNGPIVHGIQMRGSYRQDDATQRVAHNHVKTAGANIVEGSDKYLNQTYTYYTDIIEINPDTASGFTGTEANALQGGPKVHA